VTHFDASAAQCAAAFIDEYLITLFASVFGHLEDVGLDADTCAGVAVVALAAPFDLGEPQPSDERICRTDRADVAAPKPAHQKHFDRDEDRHDDEREAQSIYDRARQNAHGIDDLIDQIPRPKCQKQKENPKKILNFWA
jgi:hypothetical protein